MKSGPRERSGEMQSGEAGYTNSQTWQAWLETYQVLWNNTSLIFVASVCVSVVVVVVSWILSRSRQHYPQSRLTQPKEPHEECLEKDTVEKTEDSDQDKRDVDKVIQYGQHLPGQVKRAQQRSLEKSIETEMSEEQRATEREIQSQQLAAIFKMMKEQEEKFGETTMDEIKDQMKLYCG